MPSVNLILYYINAGDLKQAQEIFEVMADLGDNKEVIILRAKVSVDLLGAYGNAADLSKAQEIFDAMSKLGDNEEIVGIRTKAQELLDTFKKQA